LSERRRRDIVYSLARARDDQLGHGGLLYLSRSYAAVYSRQVQRSRPRPRQYGRRSAGANRQKRDPADGLSPRMGRRVSRMAAGKASPRDRRALKPRADHGAVVGFV